MEETRQSHRGTARKATGGGWLSQIQVKNSQYFDFNLLAVVVILVCFGLIMLYSTSAYISEVNQNNDMYYFAKQALVSLACMVAMYFISTVNYRLYRGFSMIFIVAAFALMGLVQTPLGRTVNGATRWLSLGPLSFQPAEFAKLALILGISDMIVKEGSNIRQLKSCGKLLCLGGGMGLAAYLLTDNLSTALILIGISVGLIFLAHPDTRIFIIAGVVMAVLILILVLFLLASSGGTTSGSFRIRRIQVWLHPEDYASTYGYQTLQALYAIGSGGLFGRGLGNSIQKLGNVPEAQNDMIFSIVCEELGIVGAALVLALFAYLLWRLFFIAQNAPDLYGTLIVSGIFIHISLQVILNVAVVLNILPNTGITLPFFSYGGTSILFLMAEIGIALGVSRTIRFHETAQSLKII